MSKVKSKSKFLFLFFFLFQQQQQEVKISTVHVTLMNLFAHLMSLNVYQFVLFSI